MPLSGFVEARCAHLRSQMASARLQKDACALLTCWELQRLG